MEQLSSINRYQLDHILHRFKGQDIHIVGDGTTRNALPISARNVWTVDDGFRSIPQAELTFVMDSFNGCMWDAFKNKEELLECFKQAPIPVVSAVAPEGFDSCVPLPLKDLLEKLMVAGEDGKGVYPRYFSECVDYALAFAIYAEVRSITLWGLDYTKLESMGKRACAEFWLGVGFGKGILIHPNPQSKLLCTPPYNHLSHRVPGLYGYTEEDIENIASGRSEDDIEGSDDMVAA